MSEIQETQGTQELVRVVQLPIIEEQLIQLKEGVEARVNELLALKVSEDTYKKVKAYKAQLNKDFNFYEKKRKEIKKKILEPYEAFEAVYKSCLTDVIGPAEKELTKRITEVEDGLKAEKEKDARDYFNEYCEAQKIDFVKFEDTGVKIGLSNSLASIKRLIKAYIDRICDDLRLIETQEFKEEILVEYKTTRNISLAVVTVNNRHEAIKAEQERRKAEEERRAREAEAAAKVEEAVESNAVLDDFFKAPQVVVEEEAPLEVPEVMAEQPIERQVEIPAPNKEVAPEEEQTVYEVSFRVRTTNVEDLKALKNLLTERGMTYEQF